MHSRRRTILYSLLGLVVIAGVLVAAAVVPRLPALRCLLAFQGDVPPDLENYESPPAGFRLIQDPARYGVDRAWIAEPPGHGPHPVLLFVHGVAAQGIRDGRIVRAVRAFARAGFLVVAPEVGGLVDPTARQGDEERLVRLLQAIAAGRVDRASTHRIGAVGISVGGAVLLKVSAAFVGGGGRGLRAVLSIGAPHDIRRPALAWFSLPNPDPEGGESLTWKRRNAAAFARNFLSRAALAKRFGENPDRPVLRKWLADTPIPEQAPEGLGTDAGRAFAAWFLSNPTQWTAERDAVIQDGWDQLLPLSPTDWKGDLHHLRGVAVFLLHGEGDPLVPVTEATHLREALRPHTMVSVLLSRMVGHTTVENVGPGERLAHLTFMDDFLDMVGR